jgi:hypothetical protein
MATDNPNKKKADAKRISKQKHEKAYQAQKKRISKSTASKSGK